MYFVIYDGNIGYYNLGLVLVFYFELVVFYLEVVNDCEEVLGYDYGWCF